jgi:ABC transport system ATP-binding/permease protein
VLDEPTNDLDLETLDLLQEMLGDYQGTILLVSHDRDFLDRVATSILMFEGDGKWTEYAGGYSDMVAQRGAGINARTVKVAVGERAASSPQPAKPQTRRKLTFKDKHALETLPAKMASLHDEIAKLETKLADPELFASDPKAFEKAMTRHQKAKAEMTQAEEQWLELEMLKEELEAN